MLIRVGSVCSLRATQAGRWGENSGCLQLRRDTKSGGLQGVYCTCGVLLVTTQLG